MSDISNFSINKLQKGVKRHTKKANIQAEYDTSHFCFIPIYQWLNGIKIKNYTNMLHDRSQFFKELNTLIFVIIPNIYSKNPYFFHGYNPRYPHCHIVSRKDKPKVFYSLINIFNDMHHITYQDIFGDNEQGINIWEVGFKQGARIFGIYNSTYNNFYPLLCDWNHLVYSSVKYNQSDYKHNSFDPKILLHIIGSTLRMYL